MCVVVGSSYCCWPFSCSQAVEQSHACVWPRLRCYCSLNYVVLNMAAHISKLLWVRLLLVVLVIALVLLKENFRHLSWSILLICWQIWADYKNHTNKIIKCCFCGHSFFPYFQIMTDCPVYFAGNSASFKGSVNKIEIQPSLLEGRKS